MPPRGFLWRMWLRGLVAGAGRGGGVGGRVCGSQEEGRAQERALGSRGGRTHLELVVRRALADTRGRGKVRGMGRVSPVQSESQCRGWTPALGTEHRAHRAHTAHSQHPGARLQDRQGSAGSEVSLALSWPVTGREDTG